MKGVIGIAITCEVSIYRLAGTVFLFFKHKKSGALAEIEAVSVGIEWPAFVL
jgi:hypothetical protein